MGIFGRFGESKLILGFGFVFYKSFHRVTLSIAENCKINYKTQKQL